FPKDEVRKIQWRLAVCRQGAGRTLWEPTKNSYLCSRHFRPEMFDRTGQNVRLRETAVPTEFDFTDKTEVCPIKKWVLQPYHPLDPKTGAQQV
ncbi:THAP6 protein, partial [Atractosteus spatula]|nr:THAP6 protein [Atractosteus spatula]